MDPQQILLADDDDALRGALREYLRRLGFHVHEAFDGPTALELARTLELRFSIMDVHMPGMSGLEVLRTLQRERRAQASPPLPCILISAAADAQERNKALEYGAFRFLMKPFAPNHLVECLRDLLQACYPGSSADLMVERLLNRARPDAGGQCAGPPMPLDLLFSLLFRAPSPPKQP